MSRRYPISRALAVAGVLMAAGCLSTPTTDNVPVETTSHTAPISSPTIQGTTVEGTVKGADGSVLAQAQVILADARVLEVPNAGESTTAADGTYTLKPVPGVAPWFAVATDKAGNRLANIFLPSTVPTKAAECNITLGTSLAASGVSPYFVVDPAHPENTVYLLQDLDIATYAALVAAVEANLPTDAVPGTKLRDLNAPFNSLKDANAAVGAAFTAFLNATLANSRTRLAGGTAQPGSTAAVAATNASLPSAAASTSVPATTAATTSPPVAAAGASSIVTISSVAETATRVSVEMQLAGNTFELATGTKIATTNVPLPNFTASAVKRALVFDPAVPATETVPAAKAVTYDGATLVFLTATGATVGDPLSSAFRNVAISGPTGFDMSKMVDLAVKNNVAYMTDQTENLIYRCDLQAQATTATATIFAGMNSAGAHKDGAATSAAQFSAPQGICFNGTNLVVADSGNNCIRQISTVDGSVTTLSGAAGPTTLSGAVDGAKTDARFNAPSDVVVDAAGNIFVADSGNNAIRKVDSTGACTTVAGNSFKAGNVDGNTGTLTAPTCLTLGSLPITASQASQAKSLAGITIPTPLEVLVVSQFDGNIRAITIGI